MTERVFQWKWCRLIRAVDGDTIDVLIDRGFHDQRTERLRILGVDCPEVHGTTKAAGLAATAFTQLTLAQWAAQASLPDWPLVVHTHKTDDFGRYLADVYSPTGLSLAEVIIRAGYGIPRAA